MLKDESSDMGYLGKEDIVILLSGFAKIKRRKNTGKCSQLQPIINQ